MRLRSGELSAFKVAYSVVDLPDPVGPGDEDRPVGLAVGDLVAFLDRRQETELGEVERGARLVEHPEDDLLAVHRRQRGDAQVDLAPARGERDAAVLGDTVLGDVEARHDLETRRSRHPGSPSASG